MPNYNLKFESPKGKRLGRYYVWVVLTSKDSVGFWYDKNARRWTEKPEGPYSSAMRCRTLRAFKRWLRKNPDLWKYRPVLVNRYKGHDIEAQEAVK